VQPRKRSIHIGVNTVDAAAYAKPPARLTAAEADADAMAGLTTHAGVTATSLTGRDATRDAVLAALQHAAAELVSGDNLIVTFSGHGSRREDTAPEPDDDRDGFDECWCLWDGVLVDDDIHRALAGFERGVRVYVLSDSCYSGTILRTAAVKLRSRVEVQASVLLSAAAGESELTFTTEVRGLFTAAVLTVWDEGRFQGDHLAFHAAIRAASAAGQVPDLARYGLPSAEFERSRPFGAP